jgi:hypothetical protein
MAQGGIMTNEEKMAKQRMIHEILLDNCDLSVIRNCINNTLNYEGVDISEPLMTIYDYFMTRLRVACGLPVVAKEGKYNFVRDKKPKVYISGRISGLSEKVYKNNFNSAELYLTGLGYDVVNPVSYPQNPNWKWEDYMKFDIKLLMDCDYIYLLEGWESSDGASLEHFIATNVGIKVLRLDDNGVMV